MNLDMSLEQEQYRGPRPGYPGMNMSMGMGMGMGMPMGMGMGNPMGMSPMNMAMGPMGMPMPLIPGQAFFASWVAFRTTCSLQRHAVTVKPVCCFAELRSLSNAHQSLRHAGGDASWAALLLQACFSPRHHLAMQIGGGQETIMMALIAATNEVDTNSSTPVLKLQFLCLPLFPPFPWPSFFFDLQVITLKCETC